MRRHLAGDHHSDLDQFVPLASCPRRRRLAILRRWALPVVAGVVVASALARYAPEQLFKIVFVAMLGFSALRLLFAPDGWKFADEMPGRILMSVYGLIIGSLSALMGIGGGQIANLFMTFHGRLDPSGDRDVVRTRRADRDPGHARLHLCRLAARGGISERRRRCSFRTRSATSR